MFPYWRTMAALPALGLLWSCGNVPSPVLSTAHSSACPPSGALIVVTESTLTPACGCGAANERAFGPDDQATCEIAAGNSVLFAFYNRTESAQISPTSNPEVPLSPVFNRLATGQSFKANSFGFTLDSAGDYHFQNTFNPSLKGVIRVTP